MNIDFTEKRWDEVKSTYDLWRNKKLNRSIVGVTSKKPNYDLGLCKAPLLTQANCCNLNYSVKDIAETIYTHLCQLEYWGDAFPMYNMACFGPGIIAAMLGADIDNSTGQVWFSVKEHKPIKDLHFEFNDKNIWFNRIYNIFEACMDKFAGKAIMSMPDVGGALDILATFRGTNNLLLDLYDEPEELLRVIIELDDIWFKIFRKFADILESDKYGYTDWSAIYSDKPSYVLQCDFSYMISNEMFNKFVLPSLERDVSELENNMYHLDGPGQLVHVDTLINIKKLDAIQWIPGYGNPTYDKYPKLYNKIISANKLVQVPACNFEVLLNVMEQTKKPGYIHGGTFEVPYEKREYVVNWLKRLNIID